MKMNGIMQKEQDDRKSCQKEKKKKPNETLILLRPVWHNQLTSDHEN